MNFDVAIIGAGIVGAACAYRLAREGLAIVVVDAGQIGGGATGAGMGHIAVMDDSEAQFALTELSRSLWHRLAEELPASNEFERCGTIWVAADDLEMDEARRKLEFYRSRGVAAEILDEKALSEVEPGLRDGLCGGLLVPDDGVVYQPCAASFLFERAAAKSNVQILTESRCVRVLTDGILLENGRRVNADKVIVAAGSGAPELVPGLKIVKRKGHLVITERYPGFVRHQLVELGYLKSAHSIAVDSVAFNVQPRLTGQILIGSSRQFGAENADVDYRILGRMIKRALAFMPGLGNLSAVRIWTGFRPATPDNLPYIGRHQEMESVYLAAGHEGLGITTSLGTAELLADEILGRTSAIPREPYSPGRFEQ